MHTELKLEVLCLSEGGNGLAGLSNAMVNTKPRSNSGSKAIILAHRLQVIIEGSKGKHLEAGNRSRNHRGTAYWLTPLLSYLPYAT